MNPDELIKQIEAEAAKILNDDLQSGEINKDRAQEIASFIIKSLHPHMSLEEIQQVLQNFDDNFPELRKIHLDIEEELTSEIRKHAIAKVDELIKQEQVEKADNVLGKALKDEHKTATEVKTYYQPVDISKFNKKVDNN